MGRPVEAAHAPRRGWLAVHGARAGTHPQARCTGAGRRQDPLMKLKWLVFVLLLSAFCLVPSTDAFAHGVTAGDKGYIQETSGTRILPFIYLGAKHMVTGYDHLLFLVGVIFFLYRMKDIGIYVTLFALGHSTTLLLGRARPASASARTSSTRSSASPSSTRRSTTSARSGAGSASSRAPGPPRSSSASSTASDSPPSSSTSSCRAKV